MDLIMNDITRDYQSSFFTLEIMGEIAVLRICRPRLSDEDNVEQLGVELMNIVDQLGYEQLVLSLGGVEMITSSILGKLIHLHRHLQRLDGEMVICDLDQGVQEVMQMSRLHTYFRCAVDVPQAITFFE